MKRLDTLKYIFFISLFFLNAIFAQKPEYSLSFDSELSTRKIILLNKNWSYNDGEDIKSVDVPIWLNEDQEVLTKKIRLDEERPSIYFLRFDGVRGLDEIYFNEERIPFDKIELEKFSFRIPSNIIRENGENFVKLIFSKKFRLKEQNVLASKINLPERKLGIFKDVYIEILPEFSISTIKLIPTLYDNIQTGRIEYTYEISSFMHISADSSKKVTCLLEIIDPKRLVIVSSLKDEFDFQGNSIIRRGELKLDTPVLWDPQNPFFYQLSIKLFLGRNLIDQYFSHFAFKKIEIENQKLYINNNPIVLHGVTYFETNGFKNSFFHLKDYERDINLIKELNANSIFVKNSLPSNELLLNCELNGILVFIDLDSKVYPFPENQDSKDDKLKKLDFVINNYSKFGCIVGICVDHPSNSVNSELINTLTGKIEQEKLNLLKFIETTNFKLKQPATIDFMGYNLLHKDIFEITNFLKSFDDDRFRIISGFGFSHGLGEKAGYANPYSIQAQAKYLSDVIKILFNDEISFFVHAFSDYRLPYHSLIAGKQDNELMKYGLLNENRDEKKLSFNLLKAYLTRSKLPLIMQGEYTDKANIIFVLSGLILLTLIILTINSTHRFRENVSRAILKTYNFFSDIRDGWLISSFHSGILAITVALAISLTHSSFIYYWKDKVDFERFLSLFNSSLLFEFFSYIAWRPIESILYFTVISILWILLLTLIIKFFNLFVRNKIFLSHSFLISVWSAVPFLILIPLSMVAPKIFSLQKYNWLVYFVVILFHIWVFTRTIKGISIVFEVKKLKVYLFAFAILIIVLSGLILYLQINFSSLDYFMEYFS